MNIVIIGSGAWGCAFAQVFMRQGFSCTLVAPNEQWAEYAKETCDLRVIISREYTSIAIADSVYVATPLQYLRNTLMCAAPYAYTGQPWVMLSKGLEQTTLLTPYELLQKLIPVAVPLVLVGPSGSSDVIAGDPVGLVCAARSVHTRYITHLQSQFEGLPLTIQGSCDIMGVSWCGAVKNSIAFGVGILRGLSYGHSTVGLLITRGIFEMGILVTRHGGDFTTVVGLAGIGDLVATAGSTWSRNVQAGIACATGVEYSQTAEGVETLRALEPLYVKIPELVLLKFLNNCAHQRAHPTDIKNILLSF